MLASATALVLALALGAAPVVPEPVAPAPAPTAAPEVDPPTPVEPAAPGEPSTPAPGEPTTPGEPSTPAPGEPTTPGEPSTPAPGEPTTPGDAAPVGPADAAPPVASDDGDDDPFGEHADEAPWPEGEGEGEGDEDDGGSLPDYDPLRDSPQALRARHWVRTGIGTLAAGGALLVGAILMGTSDPCARRAGNNCQVQARNRAALVMGIPAALLVGGGGAMLGVGLARRHRLALELQASRTRVGLGVRGRF